MQRNGGWLLALVLVMPIVRCDFLYPDFNDTTGLVFNRNAATTSCDDDPVYSYQERHGSADDNVEPPGNSGAFGTVSESTASASELRVTTDDPNSSDEVKRALAKFGHRDSFVASQDPRGCRVRLRLTGSQPFHRGSVWRTDPQTVMRGFETEFVWHVSDHSRRCSQVRDTERGSALYQSCVTHGGDGFAFVLQNDPARHEALGAGGSGVGMAGLQNALAVVFDTWSNPEEGDVFTDHVTVLTSGADSDGVPRVVQGREVPDTVLSRNPDATLAGAHPHPIADGKLHRARITYYPYIKMNLLEYFQLEPASLPFLLDQGEGRRIGTLVVWVDDMRRKHPLLAIPINLNAALNAPGGSVIPGFTSATGHAFEKHDILYWHFCEAHNCPQLEIDPEDAALGVDYHQESNVNIGVNGTIESIQ